MCIHCNWEELLEEIDELIDNPRLEFAQDILEGIQDWVSENEHCTDNQKEAIDNIGNCNE